MIADTTRFGSISAKSTLNSSGLPNQQAGSLLKMGGYLRGLEAINTKLETYYLLIFDQPQPPANNLQITDTAYKPPKLVITCQPATALNAYGRVVKTDNQLKDTGLYQIVPPETKKTDYFKKGISFAVSTDKTRYVSPVGVYPVSVDVQVAPGKLTGFNPGKHGVNVGQEAHPAKPAVTIDGVYYPAILNKQFDLRPGGDLETRCDRWTADSRKVVRLNYVPFDFSQLNNWKEAALYIKSRGFEVLLGWTAASNGNIDKARYDTFISSALDRVQWAAVNGFKYIGIANEEGNHANKTATFTMAYIIGGIFAKSVECRTWLDANGYTDVRLSASFSEGERAETAAQYSANVANGFAEFCFNEYDNPANFVAHIADAHAVFGSKLVVTEFGLDDGINDATIGGNENEQAIDYIIKRNVLDYYGIKSYIFCDDDSGAVGGVLDQFGLITSTGRKRKAYGVLLEL
jgi:hypothetical protein